MAKKTSADQSSSGSRKKRRTPGVSRKVIGKTRAPYERKKGDKGEEEEEDKKRSGGATADKGKSGAGDDKAATRDDKAKNDKKDDKAEAKDHKDDKKDDKAEAKDHKDDKAKAPKWPGEVEAEDDGAASWGDELGSQKGGDRDSKDDAAPSKAPAAADSASDPARAGDAAAAQTPDGAFEPAPALDPNAEFAELWPPTFIGRWDPDAPAPAPAKAPPGDSRSFRRWRGSAEEFVLIYRSGSHLIKRAGPVGRMGRWEVAEYPDAGAAAHAYAQECSELTGAGYRDLR